MQIVQGAKMKSVAAKKKLNLAIYARYSTEKTKLSFVFKTDVGKNG